MMRYSSNASLLSLLFIFSLPCSLLVSALDTITASQFIQEPETRSSNNNLFTLGFFSPENSTNRYVGIWYMSKSAVIWVANRNQPLKNSSGVVTISEDGNLVVLDGKQQVVWSTNLSNISSNSTAQLSDSGNLVLLDKTTKESAWESFQHPSNTLLPNMKLSTNLETGEKVQVTSWRSPSDPSYGRFSAGLGQRKVIESFVWDGNHPYWRSGPWNGYVMLGIPKMVSVFYSGFHFSEDEGTFNGYYNFANKSVLSIYVLNPEGIIEQRLWDYENEVWKRDWTFAVQESECDIYGICGPFGICNSQSSPICSCLRGFVPRNKEEWDRQNWTSGCVRREALQCQRPENGSETGKADGFLKLKKTKVPDFIEWSSIVDRDCRTPCLKNCSCIAYAYDASIGCMFWSSELIDIQSFSYGGNDLYIRLAYKELEKERNSIKIITITVVIGMILLIMSAYFLWKRFAQRTVFNTGKKKTRNANESKIENLKQVRVQELSLFDFKELATATNNFDSANKLGQGGFGPVFKGKLLDGQEIAVKRLSRASRQGIEEFLNEVQVISKLQHRNLVRLLGCCIEGDEEMLIYECMPNKSLDAFVFDPIKKKVLDWQKRFNIIGGISRGLLYLQRDSRLRIIHRDLKPSNILLDEELNPKISDFGMARIFGSNEDEANTKRIVGTYGYMSPEYAIEGLFSEKSDVFSFGVLLLEIVSGRRNTSFYEDAESLSLIGFAWKLWKDNNITSLVDPEIYDPNFHEDILRCIHIGLLCVQELARDRPIMATVISMLHSEILDIPAPSQPAFIHRQTMSSTALPTQRNNELCSINSVTMTEFEGR